LQGEVGDADGDEGADKLVADDFIYIGFAVLEVNGLAGNGEGVGDAGGGDGDGDVGFGEQAAVAAVDFDEGFANDAAGVLDDCGGESDDVSAPGVARAGVAVPLDLDTLADGELADFGLVEVGADTEVVQVGHL
jgi:hypothetical protein